MTPKPRFTIKKIKFKVQRNYAKSTSKISSSVTFHQHFQVFHMDFKICSRHLVLSEVISFEKILNTFPQQFVIKCK